ncbi:MAG TPA: hypothetical protein VK745_13315 [Polyangiaceae bacterium]|nr:hypothetical protein [Polyangiaceae bacterium]
MSRAFFQRETDHHVASALLLIAIELKKFVTHFLGYIFSVTFFGYIFSAAFPEFWAAPATIHLMAGHSALSYYG